ncbi:threonine--tRNA ligase [Candidatus Uhrbacteria bacterium]|nr:threonine--tRNA ligase [Candidatus Uhrbacteria bacterium]
MDQHELEQMRHSFAHLLAAAVMELWPETKRTIGPAIDNGFYFDFEFVQPISEADFPAIEKKMRSLMQTWTAFERFELSPEEAKREYPGNEFKHELIDQFSGEGQTLTFYKSGNYWDLCRGGHSEGIAHLSPMIFKLTKLAGAYWRGDEKNAMLTRIYGVAFETQAELKAYFTMLEEASKRDHRKLGKELDLFVFSDLVGPGLPLWTPRGTILRNKLDEFVWSLRQARGYQKVEIPHITKKELYETSGHWEKFQDELFKITTREGHVFAMKPMNCPHHTQIFDRKQHSYREMPQRFANTTMCYRDEQTGELHGLSRLRSFTQDDAHVFCRESQVKEEVMKIWDIIETFYGAFGFTLKLRLSTHDPDKMEKYLGGAELWEKSVSGLKEMLEERGAEYVLGVGEAAFYGPKIDFITKDSIGREWQVATIQLDRNLPERFNLSCVNESGEQERVVMIHAAIMGAIERFLSVMIEHTAGAFPFWLAPVQIVLATVGQDYIPFANELEEKLLKVGVRVELDASDEKLGKKIRDAAKNKVPWTIVIGAKEVEGGDFNVKVFGQEEDLSIGAGELIDRVKQTSQFPE